MNFSSKVTKVIYAISLLVVALLPVSAMAHVVVTPKEAKVGQELTFNVSVPNERDTAVVGLSLMIPSSVSAIMPTAKPGWIIQTKSPGGSNEVTEISWTRGSVPVGQRDDFSFSSQVPSTSTTVVWKAYEQYADGTIVAWDQVPKTGTDDATGNSGPYSSTTITNDLTPTPSHPGFDTSTNFALVLSLVALGLSGYSFMRARRH